MKTRIFVTVLIMLCLISQSSGSVKAQNNEITITDLGTLGGNFSYAQDINNLGQVVGYSLHQTGEWGAFLWTEVAGIQDIGIGSAIAYGINDLSQIVGEQSSRAFLWTAENGLLDLGAFEYSSTATAINNIGQVTGYSTSSMRAHAFIWTSENGMQDIETRYGQYSYTTDINDSSQIVGWGPNAFVWSAENGFQDLGTLGGNYGLAYGINKFGQIVGYSQTTTGYEHAFLWQPGKGMQDLGTLGGNTSYAMDINDRGQVVGYSETSSGETHAFLWTKYDGMQDIGVLSENGNSYARAINNTGQIAGESDTGSGQIHAVMWITPQVNLPPVADAGGPYTAYQGGTIALDASNSYDPEEGLLTYEWDLNNDGLYDDATGVTTDISFANAGSFTVGLRVTDTGGLRDTDTADVTINNLPLKWKSRLSMPTARYSTSAAISNNKIYVIGGDNYSCTPLTNVEEYDPTTNSWNIRTSMPTGRWGLSAATGPDGRIYAFGGWGGDCGSTLLSTVEIYDPVMDTWDVGASMPTQRYGFGVAAAANGKIYVFGGENSTGMLASVEEYDPATNTWLGKADMPHPRKSFTTTAASNGKIYLLGGDPLAEELQEYDPMTDNWTSRAMIPTTRYGVQMLQGSDGRIFAIGGVSVWDEFLNTVESYNPLTDTWRTETSIKTPRSGHAVVSMDQYIFAIGGGGRDPYGNFTPLNSVEAASVTGVEVNFPPVANPGSYRKVSEGSPIKLNASGSYDPDGDPLTYEWDLDNDSLYDDATGVTTSITFADNGTFTVGLRVTDDGGLSDTKTTTITVSNRLPILGAITAPIEPVIVNTTIYTSVNFTDPGILDTHRAFWYWGDNVKSPGTITESNGTGSATGTHNYKSVGVYTVTVVVVDDDGGQGTSEFQYIVVYDPNSGFVTGSGWINSPEGAYTPDPTLTGKATFGFVSKYQKGANVPTGVTGFQFNVADFYFESTSYDWLVIAGDKAQYKGTGTINGMGEYKFMLTAIDGSPDKFRIKIWDKATGEVIYDNQLSAEDTTDPTTAIQGGSIVIHKPK